MCQRASMEIRDSFWLVFSFLRVGHQVPLFTEPSHRPLVLFFKLCECLSVWVCAHRHVLVSWDEGIKSCGAGITHSCEVPDNGCWEPNWSSVRTECALNCWAVSSAPPQPKFIFLMAEWYPVICAFKFCLSTGNNHQRGRLFLMPSTRMIVLCLWQRLQEDIFIVHVPDEFEHVWRFM